LGKLLLPLVRRQARRDVPKGSLAVPEAAAYGDDHARDRLDGDSEAMAAAFGVLDLALAQGAGVRASADNPR